MKLLLADSSPLSVGSIYTLSPFTFQTEPLSSSLYLVTDYQTFVTINNHRHVLPIPHHSQLTLPLLV